MPTYAFQQCKNFENQLRFDKVTHSLKVGTFLRHTVEIHKGNEMTDRVTFEARSSRFTL